MEGQFPMIEVIKGMTIQELEDQLKDHFYNDRFFEAEEVISNLKNLLQEQVLFSKERPYESLTMDSSEVKEFFGLPECKYTLKDREMIDFVVNSMEPLEGEEWTQDKSSQQVYYKQEEGCNLVTCYSETLINVPYIQVLAMVGEVENMKELYPEIQHAALVQALTESRAMYHVVENMPWPLWPRDLVFSSNIIFDKARKAFLICSTSLQDETDWFGYPIPPVPPGHVRIIMKRECHYFQRLDAEITRYVCIQNSDPQFTAAPTSMMNWVQKKMSECMAFKIKEKAEKYLQLSMKVKQRRPPSFYERLQGEMEAAVAKEKEESE